LGTNVDVPPDWEMDLDPFINNISDLTSTISWVGLDVDCFERVLKLDIVEVNPSDASMVLRGRNRSDCHTNTKFDITIPNNDVL
jgi:hypothetical protein